MQVKNRNAAAHAGTWGGGEIQKQLAGDFDPEINTVRRLDAIADSLVADLSARRAAWLRSRFRLANSHARAIASHAFGEVR